MSFRLRDSVLRAHNGQWLPMNYYSEEIDLVLSWADPTERVQP